MINIGQHQDIIDLIKKGNFSDAKRKIDYTENLELFYIVRNFAREGNIEALDFLMNRCSNSSNSSYYFSSGDKLDNEILYIAIEKNKVEALNTILSSRMYKEYTHNFKSTLALLIAARDNKLEAVSLLLDKAKNLSLDSKYHNSNMFGDTQNNGKTSLGFAIQNSNMEMFNLLHKVYMERGKEATIQQEIHSALNNPGAYSIEMFDFLFSQADTGMSKVYFLSKTFEKSIKANNNDLIEHILNLPTDMLDQTVNSFNEQPLCHYYFEKAIENGSVNIVRILLEKGLSKYETDGENNTPLMIAAKNGNIEIVRLLLGFNRNEQDLYSDIQNSSNKTALFIAAEKGHNHIVQLLIEDGADPDILAQGKTPLSLAIRNDNTELVRIILEDETLINLENNNSGETPLLKAIEWNRPQIANLLITKGANVNAIDGYGYSALENAISSRFFDVAENLITAGANIHHIRDNGESALLLAYEQGDLDIANLLIRQGAELDFLNENTKALITRMIESSYSSEKIKHLILNNEIDDYSIFGEAVKGNFHWIPSEKFDLLNIISACDSSLNQHAILDQVFIESLPNYATNHRDFETMIAGFVTDEE